MVEPNSRESDDALAARVDDEGLGERFVGELARELAGGSLDDDELAGFLACRESADWLVLGFDGSLGFETGGGEALG